MPRLLEASLAAAVVLLGSCDDPTGPANLPPTADAVATSVLKGTQATVRLPVADADGDSLSWRIVRGPDHGEVRVTAAEGDAIVAVYTPDAGFSGVDSFDYLVHDGRADATGTVRIEVVDPPPVLVAWPDSVTRPALASAAVWFEVVAADPQGDALALELVDPARHGEVVVETKAAGDTVAFGVTYTAGGAPALPDTLRLAASDGRRLSDVAKVAVRVNRPPTAEPVAATTRKGTPVTLALRGWDPDGHEISFRIVGQPEHGTVSDIAPAAGAAATVLYRPAPGFSGTDGFEVAAWDGFDVGAPAAVEVVVENGVPTARAATVEAPKNGSASILLTGSDPDGDALTFTVVEGPASGSLGPVVPAGDTAATVLYAPAAGFDGEDAFVFAATDGTDASEPAEVRILVPNGAPLIDRPEPVAVAAGGSVAVTLTGSDPDGDPLEFVVASPPAAGDVASLTSTGRAGAELVYRAGGEAGTVRFAVAASDGTDASSPVEIEVRVDGGPSARDVEAATIEDNSHTVTLRATDPEAGALEFEIVAPPEHGALGDVEAGDGGDRATVVYSPAAEFAGQDAFTYRVTDAFGLDAVGRVTIEVEAVNDAPSFTAGGDVAVAEDSGPYEAAWASAVTAGPEEGAQSLAFTVSHTNAALFDAAPAIDAAGRLTFTPAADANGESDVTVRLEDDGGTANGGADSSPAVTFTIRVESVNEPPTFTAAGDVAVLEDAGPQTVAGWASGLDAGAGESFGGGAGFEVVSVTDASLFAAAPAVAYPSGDLTFTPAADAAGAADVTVVLRDGEGGTSSAATFEIALTPVNDAPSFAAGVDVAVAEDSAPYEAAWASAASAGPGEGAQSLAFTVSHTNAALFDAAPAIDAAGRLTFTPAADANGESDVTVRLEDDGGTANGGADSSPAVTFTITVAAVNDPPEFRVVVPGHTVGTWDTIPSGRPPTDRVDLVEAPGGGGLRVAGVIDLLPPPASEAGQDRKILFTVDRDVITFDYVEKRPAQPMSEFLVVAEAAAVAGDTTIVEVLAVDSIPGAPVPLDTTRIPLRVLFAPPPTIDTATVRVIGEEGAACIPLDLPSSMEVGYPHEDPDGDGDGERSLVVSNPNSGIAGEVFYRDTYGSLDYIGSGDTVTLPLGTSVCFEPRDFRHSTFDTATGEFEVYATLQVRARDGLGSTSETKIYEIVVTPVF